MFIATTARRIHERRTSVSVCSTPTDGEPAAYRCLRNDVGKQKTGANRRTADKEITGRRIKKKILESAAQRFTAYEDVLAQSSHYNL